MWEVIMKNIIRGCLSKFFVPTFLVVVCIISVSCVSLSKHKNGKHPNMDITTETRFIERLKFFEENPNINDCVSLMNDYWYLEEYDQVINMGENCIKLDVENESPMFIVYLWMAAAYNKKEDFGESIKHLERALNLDENNIIENNKNIQIYDLETIYSSIKKANKR